MAQIKEDTGLFRVYLRGSLDADGIQVKTLAAMAMLSPETLSRKINGHQPLTMEDAFHLGAAWQKCRQARR